MATKQGRKDYQKLLKLVQSMEEDYKSASKVPSTDKRMEQCHKLMKTQPKSSSVIPIKVRIRHDTVICSPKYENMYDWFINENGTVAESYSRFGQTRGTGYFFFMHKCHTQSHIEAKYKGKLLTAPSKAVMFKKLKARGCHLVLSNLIENYSLSKVYEINKAVFEDDKNAN